VERVVASGHVLAGVAPAVLDRLRGRPSAGPEGAQVKINMVLDRLPRLRSGHDPARAFAGTFHIDEGYAALEAGYVAAAAGTLPDPLPGEVYCHTLTDPSILAPELAARGVHTLTLFGLHAPPGCSPPTGPVRRRCATRPPAATSPASTPTSSSRSPTAWPATPRGARASRR
ncbi:MAG TPA: hypothetical protein VHK25_12870, partial [Acidimicrobiales bacterium]|nr:hypothetical protein [Acidimicrobiales bacterium]